MNLKPCPAYALDKKRRRGLHQTLLTMRLIILLTVLTCFKVTAAVYAQNISLNLKEQPIEKAFDEIKRQSGYQFFYNDRMLENTVKVTVSLKKASLNTALDECFKNQPITYEIVGKSIVVKIRPQAKAKKSEAALQEDVKITGKVVDEKGNPLSRVTIKIKGSDRQTFTDDNGNFSIEVPDENAILEISIIGYETAYFTFDGSNASATIKLKEAVNQLNELTVVNTGYQSLPKERATGSFVQIDNELLNRSTTGNVLDRLKGMVTGFYYIPYVAPRIANTPNTKNTGITIRGVSTYRSSTDPLVVVDNFPYEGEINNINPNDIESITILKDAAAASIWGARSGNGVIVITTKKGKRNEKMNVSVNSNVTVGSKPDLMAVPGFLPSKDYIEVEQFLFDKGFFNSDISNKTSRPVVSPAVEIMALKRAGTISADEAAAQLALLNSYDIRKDYEKYIYQSDIKQQYSVGLRGGTENMTYSFGGGYDRNSSNLVHNGFNRVTVNSLSTYSPIKNFELTAALNFSQNLTRQNNQLLANMGSKYIAYFPYTRFADEEGNPLAIANDFREAYLNESEAKGFLDWHYRPLDDIANADNSTRVQDLLARFGLKYKILPQLTAEVSYQNER